MESAIPQHLRIGCPRAKRLRDGYQPAYPSFVARYEPGVKRVVMAYFGLQYRDAAASLAQKALDWLDRAFGEGGGPAHSDKARFVDELGYTNVVTAAYWTDYATFETWFTAARRGWTGEDRAFDGIGTFIEVLSPATDGFETLFSSAARAEGVAVISEGMSDPVLEHAYWGGMRDRFPRSQSSDMEPVGAPRLIREGARVTVVPHNNICLIRSGQDWAETDGAERLMYLDDVEPILRAGMEFLRDDGLSIGCYANRYVTVLTPDGRGTDRTYGMSWWKGLAALEAWAEFHPTHVAIFGAAMRYLTSLGPAARLRLYHEVVVARAEEQFFEYVNCHDGTGLLRCGEVAK